MAEPLRSWPTHDAVASGAQASSHNQKQIRDVCQFIAREWVENRRHSYAIPSSGKSSAWSRTVDGKWMAVGLADAASKYARSGRSFYENKAELDRLAADLQSAIYRNSGKDICYISRAITHWGGSTISIDRSGHLSGSSVTRIRLPTRFPAQSI